MPFNDKQRVTVSYLTVSFPVNHLTSMRAKTLVRCCACVCLGSSLQLTFAVYLNTVLTLPLLFKLAAKEIVSIGENQC